MTIKQALKNMIETVRLYYPEGSNQDIDSAIYIGLSALSSHEKIMKLHGLDLASKLKARYPHADEVES